MFGYIVCTQNDIPKHTQEVHLSNKYERACFECCALVGCWVGVLTTRYRLT